MHAENFCKLNHFSCYFQNRKTNHLLFLLRLHSDRCDTEDVGVDLQSRSTCAFFLAFARAILLLGLSSEKAQQQYCSCKRNGSVTQVQSCIFLVESAEMEVMIGGYRKEQSECSSSVQKKILYCVSVCKVDVVLFV